MCFKKGMRELLFSFPGFTATPRAHTELGKEYDAPCSWKKIDLTIKDLILFN